MDGGAKARVKADQKGILWRFVMKDCNGGLAKKITGCFAQKIGTRACAVLKAEQVSEDSWDVTWKRQVGYKSAYSWFQTLVSLTGSKRKLDWEFDLAPSAGASPASKVVIGDPPIGSRAAAIVEEPGAAASDDDNKCSGAAPPRKRPKHVTPANASSAGLGHATVVKSRGASPPSHSCNMWLIQKSLKLFCGTALDDPAASRYRISGATPLRTTPFSTTYSVLLPNSDKVVVKALHKLENVVFLCEVDFLSKLRHPNIVDLVDVATVDERLCVVTRDCGQDLSKLMRARKGAPPYPGIGLLVRQLLDGMSYVHLHDVVHSDLKPANIVVDKQGVLRLIDFGCAFVDLPGYRTMRSFDELEQKAIPYGTLPYRSIEVVLGKADFGRPMDVWAVGCIIFELTVCARLFCDRCLTPESLVSGCFAQLGQQEKIGCLAALPKWKAKLLKATATADFWRRLGASPTVKAFGAVAYSMLDIDDTKRPRMAALVEDWKVATDQSKL